MCEQNSKRSQYLLWSATWFGKKHDLQTYEHNQMSITLKWKLESRPDRLSVHNAICFLLPRLINPLMQTSLCVEYSPAPGIEKKITRNTAVTGGSIRSKFCPVMFHNSDVRQKSTHLLWIRLYLCSWLSQYSWNIRGSSAQASLLRI